MQHFVFFSIPDVATTNSLLHSLCGLVNSMHIYYIGTKYLLSEI